MKLEMTSHAILVVGTYLPENSLMAIGQGQSTCRLRTCSHIRLASFILATMSVDQPLHVSKCAPYFSMCRFDSSRRPRPLAGVVLTGDFVSQPAVTSKSRPCTLARCCFLEGIRAPILLADVVSTGPRPHTLGRCRFLELRPCMLGRHVPVWMESQDYKPPCPIVKEPS